MKCPVSQVYFSDELVWGGGGSSERESWFIVMSQGQSCVGQKPPSWGRLKIILLRQLPSKEYNLRLRGKMIENRPEDSLGSLVRTVETVETEDTVLTV